MNVHAQEIPFVPSWPDPDPRLLRAELLPAPNLPLGDVLAAVPGVPVSVELRSRALMEGYPDPVERALVIRRSLSSLAL